MQRYVQRRMPAAHAWLSWMTRWGEGEGGGQQALELRKGTCIACIHRERDGERGMEHGPWRHCLRVARPCCGSLLEVSRSLRQSQECEP